MKQNKSVTYRVLPNSGKGWAVKKDGAKRALQNFKRKQDAIDRAREVSRNQGAELQIHKKDAQSSEEIVMETILILQEGKYEYPFP